jgi:hypothetical protein
MFPLENHVGTMFQPSHEFMLTFKSKHVALALSVGQVCCKIKVPHTNMIPCSTWPELELSLSSTSARFSTSPDPKT